MDVAVYNERIMGPAHVHQRAWTRPSARPCRGAASRTSAFPRTSRSGRPSDVPRSEANIPSHSGDRSPRLSSAAVAASSCSGRRPHQRRQEGGHPRRPRLPQCPRRGPGVGREGRRRRSSSALLGKAVVPDDSPYTTGGIGLLGTAPSQDAMQECDTLVIVGSSFPYMRVLPQAGPGEVRADRHRRRRASACAIRSTSALVGDCRRVLRSAAAADPAQEGSQLPGDGPEEHEGVERAAGGARHPHGQADEAAGGRPCAQQVPDRRRHHRLRLRHRDDLGGPLHARCATR